MGSLGSLLLLGLALGMRHATDADHVVAVSAIASRERSPASAVMVGLSWGIGHALSIFLAGGAIILFGIVVPPELGLGLELVVAGILIALGIANLGGFTQRRHEHAAHSPRSAFQSLGVGLAHGLAGSAAVALLVLASIQRPEQSFAYLLVFALGTAGGMVLLTSVVALPLAYTSRRFANAHTLLTRGAGVLSLAVGLLLVYRIGFVEGLFTGAVASAQE